MKESKHRRVLIYLFSVVGCTSLFIFGGLRLWFGDTVGGLFELGAGLLALINVFILRVYKKEHVASSIILLIMVAVLMFLVFTGGLTGSGTFWFFTFPLLAFYMKGAREAFLWISGLVVLVAIAHVLGHSFFEIEVLLQLFAAFLAVSLLAYFYAHAVNRFIEEIREQEETLNKRNEALEAAVAQAQMLQKEAEEIANTSAAQTSELEKVKIATLNILEDLDSEKKSLAEAKAKDEAILSSIGDGMVATDIEGRVIVVNKAFEILLRISQEDAIGKVFTDLVNMYDEKMQPVDELERFINKTLKSHTSTHTNVSSDYYFERSDKTTFSVSVTASPIIVGEGLLGSVVVFRDVTAEKQIDKAKTEFVSLASHQLRTPLSAIRWYAELLEGDDVGELNKTQKEYVDEISRSTARMIELVNALLNVSRLELGTFHEEIEEINVPDMISDIVSEHTALIKENKIKLSQAIDSALPTLRADRKLARIVFENILSNAVKYTQDGGTVTVSLKKDNENGLLYCVQDSGIGIPKSQQDNIFKKLFRADNARENLADGTGLGLYLVKLIVQNMNGVVWFESKEGSGTSFYVKLPFDHTDYQKGK